MEVVATQKYCKVCVSRRIGVYGLYGVAWGYAVPHTKSAVFGTFAAASTPERDF